MLSKAHFEELRNHVDLLISHNDLGAKMLVNAIPTLLDHIDEQRALIDKLVKALEPFAKMGATPTVSELLYSQVMYSVYHYFVVAGDFHNASTVLSEAKAKLNG